MWKAYTLKSATDDLKEYIVTVVPKKPVKGVLLSGYSVKCNCPVQNLQIPDSRLQTLDFRLQNVYPRLYLLFIFN